MNLKEIRERAQINYANIPLYDQRDTRINDLDNLLKALDEARPAMEWSAQRDCVLCEAKLSDCVHVQARAWMKKYLEEG